MSTKLTKAITSKYLLLLSLAALLISSCIPVASAQSSGTIAFRTGLEPSTGGSTPKSMVCADFNKDNILDLAVSNFTTGTVAVFYGIGDGTFGAAETYIVGKKPYGLVTADFNGDSYPDLAVANSSEGTVNVLLNKKNGQFNVLSSFSAGTLTYSLDVGFFDADNVKDLAVADYSGEKITLFYGKGDGTFNTGSVLTTKGNPFFVKAADINKDGKDDIINSNSTSGVLEIRKGARNGKFPVNTSILTNSRGNCIDVMNIKGNGDIDIVFTTDRNTLAVLANDGTGRFGETVEYSVGSKPSGICSGNFSGHNNEDVAVVNSGAASMTILSSNARGSFDLTGTRVYEVGQKPESAVSGDFNNDGFTDAAVCNSGSGTISVLVGDGQGNFQKNVSYWTEKNRPEVNVIIDRTGDIRYAATIKVRTVDSTITEDDGRIIYKGSADPYTDYGPIDTLLTFGPGESSKVIKMRQTDNPNYRGPVAVKLYISDPSLNVVRGNEQVAVVNLMPVGELSSINFKDATAKVSKSVESVDVTVLRSGGTLGHVNCSYEIVSTDANGLETILKNGLVTFDTGSSQSSFRISMKEINKSKSRMTLTLRLYGPGKGAMLGDQYSSQLIIQ